MTDRAKDIIALYDKEQTNAGNFHSLYQSVADLMYPRSDQITHRNYPGEEKTRDLFDATAAMASLEMASGLSQNLIPPGQKFFALHATRRELNDIEAAKRYLSKITETVHEHLFTSNFLLQFNGYLRSLVVFGTANIFSEYTTFLNFRDIDIGSYLIIENSKSRIDTVMQKFTYTARQASQEWGDKVGKSVKEAMADEKTFGKQFEFIHMVRPRETWNPRFRTSAHMPIESVYVAVKDEVEVSEGGFRDFPYHVVRWTKAPNEVWGRGQGTFVLPYVRELQQMRKDFIENANKQCNPPLSILESFDGLVKTFPGALNHVTEHGVIEGLDTKVLGNFAITKEILEMQQELVRKFFFNDIFVQLSNLTGDRRTAFEIRERVAEGMQRLGPPVGRLNEEGLTPLIERVVFLLMDNGQLPLPPVELQGENFEIEYIGRLALQLKSHQAMGMQQLFDALVPITQIYPEAADIIDVDSAIRRLGDTLGVNIDDMRPEQAVEGIRRQRAEQMAAQRQLEAAGAIADGYGKTNKAPEAGSPANEVMEAVGV